MRLLHHPGLLGEDGGRKANDPLLVHAGLFGHVGDGASGTKSRLDLARAQLTRRLGVHRGRSGKRPAREGERRGARVLLGNFGLLAFTVELLDGGQQVLVDGYEVLA